jgi:hypothetical protein
MVWWWWQSLLLHRSILLILAFHFIRITTIVVVVIHGFSPPLICSNRASLPVLQHGAPSDYLVGVRGG